MGKFVIHQTPTGYTFHLKAANGETIATSEVYTTLAACKKGIESVRTNAPKAGVQNLTAENTPACAHPRFEIYLDHQKEYRFRLTATNGQTIASSEGYTAKASCENGIASVKKNAPEAPVMEPTA